MDSPYAIEMLHITKRFPGIIANDDITLQLKKGEIVVNNDITISAADNATVVTVNDLGNIK